MLELATLWYYNYILLLYQVQTKNIRKCYVASNVFMIETYSIKNLYIISLKNILVCTWGKLIKPQQKLYSIDLICSKLVVVCNAASRSKNTTLLGIKTGGLISLGLIQLSEEMWRENLINLPKTPRKFDPSRSSTEDYLIKVRKETAKLFCILNRKDNKEG